MSYGAGLTLEAPIRPVPEIKLVPPEQITELAAHLSGQPRLALDTEFHAEHRYRPDLMLLQIADPTGQVWLLDPRATDLRALGSVLASVPLIVHGGQQDVALLARATGVSPKIYLDTQRAAAMVGLGYPMRLSFLTERVLKQPMDKAAGLTDWSTRPLSEEQLRYAAEDAWILLLLAEALEEELEALGRTAWAVAASEELALEVDRDETDVDAWRAWEIAPLLSPIEQRSLAALLRWREDTGKAKDQPPRYILSDGFALDLARRRPGTAAELANNRRLPAGLVKRFGPQLLGVLRQAERAPNGPPPPSPTESLIAQALELAAAILERDTGIARALLLPHSLALEVARSGVEVLSGWRQEALGPLLSAVLRGSTTLSLSFHDKVLNFAPQR